MEKVFTFTFKNGTIKPDNMEVETARIIVEIETILGRPLTQHEEIMIIDSIEFHCITVTSELIAIFDLD